MRVADYDTSAPNSQIMDDAASVVRPRLRVGVRCRLSISSERQSVRALER